MWVSPEGTKQAITSQMSLLLNREYFRYSTSLDAHPKSTRWCSDQSPITVSTTLSHENPTLSQGNNSQKHLQLVQERAIYSPSLAHVQGEALKHLILLLSDLLKNLQC